MPDKDRIQLLVNALRSGKYTQGYGTLEGVIGDKTVNCCLGVATRVAMENGLDVTATPRLDDRKYTGCVIFDGVAGYLPRAVGVWYGFEGDPADNGESMNVNLIADGQPKTATGLNDGQAWNFDQIAAAFEETYINA